MRKRITTPLLVLGVCAGLVAAGPAAAGPRHNPGYQHPVRHDHWCAPHHRHRGGPPAWAPAHGYRGHAPGGAWAPAPVRHRSPGWNRELLGSLIGGAAGGVLGTNIGKGSGRTAAIIGGSVLGVLVGGGVGRSMEAADRVWVGQTLEHAPTRETVTWRNPDTQAAYEVTPTATYQTRDGRYCREYNASAVIGGRSQQVYGTACRQPDGSWEVVN